MNDAESWFEKGSVLRHSGNLTGALECYEKAIAIDAKYARPFVGKGNTLVSMGRLMEAIDAYNNAILLDPSLVNAWNGKANVLFELGNISEAIELYDRAISLDPRASLPWHGKGNALFKSGKLSEALAGYNKAISLDRKQSHYWSGKGSALVVMGQPQEAIKAYKEAITVNQDDATAWQGLGNALSEAKQINLALDAYDKAIALDPFIFQAWLGKAETLLAEHLHGHTSRESYEPYYCRAAHLLMKVPHKLYGGSKNEWVTALALRLREYLKLPLLSQRLILTFPDSFETTEHMSFISETMKQCESAAQLLSFIKADDRLGAKERSLWAAITNFYYGDAAAASDLLEVHDVAATDSLMSMYYSIISRQAYFEAYDEEMKIALRMADEYVKHGYNSASIEQRYYAGQIFSMAGMTEKAINCLTDSKEHLPSLYLLWSLLVASHDCLVLTTTASVGYDYRLYYFRHRYL